jgi:nucleoside-diphosphate-sugar epimerase
MTRVLVTGASGFIGVPLLRKLLQEGCEVHALDTRESSGPCLDQVTWHTADLLDQAALGQVLEEVRADRLVHLAWYVSHGSFWTAPENVEWVQASLGLLRGFLAAGGRRVLMVGSCAEYRWGGTEDLHEDTSEIAPATLYGVCKDALRRVASAYAASLDAELAWARLFFLYGPREQSGRLVPSVIRSLLAGEPVATGTGEQVRDFMHVEDAAAGIAAVLASKLTGAVNVASGEPVQIASILDTIGGLTGAGGLIERGARPTPPGEPDRLVANVDRLHREAGFSSTRSLREGLAETVDWWRERDPSSTGTVSRG